jgi:predicted ATPase/class 3 adenylate cyclase
LIKVPRIILDSVSRGETSGGFHGAALVADICGYTSRFEGMAGLGTEGAEQLSREVSSTLSSVVEACVAFDGYPVSLAGDAVTVVFHGGAEQASRACELFHSRSAAGFLPLRTSVGEGRVQWDVIPKRGWSFFSFQGSALSLAARGGSRAAPGEIPVLKDPHAHPGTETVSSPLSIPNSFSPPRLFDNGMVNEFRHVYSVFLSLENRRGSNCPREFQELVLEAAGEFGGYTSGLEAGVEGHRMLVVFGAPVTREDDARRADGFIQRVFVGAPGRVRAGAATGLVFSGAIRTPMMTSYTVLGPSVNLAARLHDSSGWNDLQCDTVFNKGSRLESRRSLELDLKGFGPGVVAHSLSPWKHRPETREAAPPLLERNDVLARLAEALKEPGASILLIGDTGMGKTRLAVEMRERNPEVFHINLKCSGMYANGSDIFADWFSGWLGTRGLEDGMPVFRENLYGFIDRLEALNDPAADRASDELLRAESVLAALVGLGWENSLYCGLDPQGRFRNTVAVISAFIRGKSLLGKTLLVVDDLQWLDPDSSRLLTAVLAELDEARPPMLILTRPDFGNRIEELGLSPITIELEPLSPAGCLAFLEWSLGRVPSEPLLEWFHRRTEGIPFFMEQYAGLLESAEFPPDEDKFPGGLHALLVARLDRLEPVLRRAVLSASVLGREFEGGLLEFVCPGESRTDLLTSGVRERVWSLSGEGLCSFVHILLREAAYRLQLPSERAVIHGRAADGMAELWREKPEKAWLVAHHLEMAGRFDHASVWYMKAGNYSISRSMNSACLLQLEKVMELSTDIDRKLAALRTVFNLHISLGDLESAEASLERAVAQAGAAPERLGLIRLMRGNLEVCRGNPLEALEYLEGIEEINPALRAQVLMLRGRARMLQAETAPAMEELLSVYRELRSGSPDDRLMAYRALGNACGCMIRLQVRLDEAEKGLREILDYAAETGNLMMETLCIGNLALVYKYLPNRFDDAMRMTRKHLELARRTGSRLVELHALGNLGSMLERRGPSPEAFSYLKQAEELAVKYGGNDAITVSKGNIAEALNRQGRHQEALEMFQEVLEICRECGMGMHRADYALEMTHVLMDMGRLEEAEESLGHVLSWRIPEDYREMLANCRGRLLVLQGRHTEAEVILRDGLKSTSDRTERFGMLQSLFTATGDADVFHEALELGERIQRENPHWEMERKLKNLREAGDNRGASGKADPVRPR